MRDRRLTEYVPCHPDALGAVSSLFTCFSKSPSMREDVENRYAGRCSNPLIQVRGSRDAAAATAGEAALVRITCLVLQSCVNPTCGSCPCSGSVASAASKKRTHLRGTLNVCRVIKVIAPPLLSVHLPSPAPRKAASFSRGVVLSQEASGQIG